jgi:quinoprotein glucose dehydrogenase
MRSTLMTILAGATMLPALQGQTKIPPGDWPMYAHDLAATRYSPLTQINANNVSKLTEVWSLRLQPATYRFISAGGVSELTPIVLNGVMYISSETRVMALDPETGKEIWSFDVPSGGKASPRGVAFWAGDRQNPPRIIFTAGRSLIALNAKTGKIDPGFGREGTVDIVVPYNGVPTIAKNVVMVGASTGEPVLGAPGNTRAYDARTGAKLWEFQSVPRPGELGHETWLNDGWKDRSGVNTWGWYETVDEERGIAYLPFGGPSTNYYGGDRPGANLFGNSIVAVDMTTGKYKWHFQTVHHDLWDADMPPAPGLMDIMVNGKKIPALAEAGKTSWMYILDRTTGKPVFGVEERPVAKGDVPGEWYSPTQPFPVKPPALARVSMKKEDLVTAADTTPEHAQACQELWDKVGGWRNEGPFTAFLLKGPGVPPTIQFPGGSGGASWGGFATDPKTGIVYIQTHDGPLSGWMEPTAGNAKQKKGGGIVLAYDRGQGVATSAPIKDASGKTLGNAPCFKPPWARFTAVNTNTGDIVWQVPLGINEALPAGKQNTGNSGSGGPVLTGSGLLFIGCTNDRRFRAYDAKTGKELWQTKFERNANAVPMSYQAKNNKQYVAVSAGDTLHVFALP